MTKKKNKLFKKENPSFETPPKNIAYDAFHSIDWFVYKELGEIHAKLICDLIIEYSNKKQLKILEWGCGPARVIRHINSYLNNYEIELYGTDYNNKSIKWCKKYIKDTIFTVNSLEPPLPYENDKFDCIYAISIFTHLSEKMHFAWIDELYRVLKVGGILIFTTHGGNCVYNLSDVEKTEFNAGQLIIRSNFAEGKKHFTAHHPSTFVKNKLLKDFEVIKHLEGAKEYHIMHDIWCVKSLDISY